MILAILIAANLVWANPPKDCPPFDQCTPSKKSWNSPKCKCWDRK